MRGGTANCSVCISDQAIGSPLVTSPNVLVAMNGPSLDKFVDTVAPGGKVFIDSSLVSRTTNRDDNSVYAISATKLSNEERLVGIANMILLGKVLREVEFSTLETVEAALKKCVPASKSHLQEHNLRAIKLGMTI